MGMDKITIEQWLPEQWFTDKYAIMELEEHCFPPELQMDEEEVEKELLSDDIIAIVAKDGDKIIGMTYGTEYSKVDQDWFDGYFEPREFSKYDENKTLYITSTCVDPQYRNKEIAIQLRVELIELCHEEGYKYLVGHANEKSMKGIYEIFGGTLIREFKNWYGSEETHVLMEQKIDDLYINYVPKIKQNLEYNCGETSLRAVLGNNTLDYSKLNQSEELGVSHEDLATFLLEYAGENPYTQYASTFEDLYGEIRLGYNPIVNYQDDGEGHYSPVIGMSQDYIFIRDVWDGLIHKYSKEEFMDMWYSKLYGYRWYLVIMP